MSENERAGKSGAERMGGERNRAGEMDTAHWFDPRRALRFALLFVTGLIFALGRDPNTHALGALLTAAGAGGLGWQAWQAERARRARQERERVRLERAQLQAARRDRDARHGQEKRTRRDATTRARLRQAERRAAERETEWQRQARQREQQAARETHLQNEARRLGSLAGADLIAEASAIFARRGFRVRPAVSPEAEAQIVQSDLWLTAPNGETDLARCAPGDRPATQTDVRDLEAFRRAANARHAYLVALAGFTPEAIQQAQESPLTLVEAHLLAHWQANDLPTPSQNQDDENGKRPARAEQNK